MIEHSKSVRLGIKKSLMIVDMPYNTYRNKKQALRNCKKVIKETKCDGVKLEGGEKIKNIVNHLTSNKIPVMGHIGILPQLVRGKFKSKGKSEKEKKQLMKDAKTLECVGSFAIVLECIEKNLSKQITKEIQIPTIGIGSSSNCDGQILVTDDIIGLSDFRSRFVKKYFNVKKFIQKSVKKYCNDVKERKFPSSLHVYKF